MNWSTIQNGIKAWFEDSTGLVAYWKNQAAPAYTAKPVGILQITSTSKVGVDSLDYVYVENIAHEAEMVPNVAGYRLITVSCMVVSRNQNAGYDALQYLELARSSLNRPSLKDALAEAGLAISWTSQTITPRDVLVDNRWESRAIFDVTFRVVQYIDFTDSADTNEYIQRAEVSSDISPSVPDSVEWDDEIIGIPPDPPSGD